MRRLWSEAESAYREKILDALGEQPSALLLDVGCDDGAWTDTVRGKLRVPPEQVAGIELVRDRAALAREKGFDVRIGDLERRWPFDAQSFDIVHANQVIEHVRRLDHFVSEMGRVLRPGGRAVVCTENLASWHNVAAVTLGYQPFSLTNISTRGPIGNPLALHRGEASPVEEWHHVHVLSLPALRDIFTVHGFAIASNWGTGYHPFTGRVASRLAVVDPRHAHFIGVVAERRGSNIAAAAAALYVLLPFDVIPDFLPYVGHLDDTIIVTLVLLTYKRRWLERFRRLLPESLRPKPSTSLVEG